MLINSKPCDILFIACSLALRQTGIEEGTPVGGIHAWVSAHVKTALALGIQLVLNHHLLSVSEREEPLLLRLLWQSILHKGSPRKPQPSTWTADLIFTRVQVRMLLSVIYFIMR